MAATYKDNGGSVNGSNKVFTYSFPVLQTEDIKVALNGVTQATTKYTPSLSPANITFNNTSVDSSVQESDGSPKSGVTVRVYRETTVGKNTGDEDPKAVFAAGSSIRAGDLNANTEQALFGIHELQEKLILAEDINIGAINTDKILDGTIVNVDISSTAEIAVSKLANGSARQVLQTAANGSDVEWTSNVNLPGTLDVQQNTKLEGNLDVTGTLDVNSATNIAGATGIDGNFDINTNKFTVASSTGNTTIAGTLDVTGLSTLASVDINGGAIDNTTIGASSAVAGTFTTINASGTITGNVTGNVTGAITGNADTATDLAAATKITASEQAAHTVNDTTYFTTSATEARYFNTSTGETIKDGDAFPDNDTTIATTAAINDRIIDLVDDVGGFVPIANELAFPNANPDVNDGTGTLVSIKTLSTNYTSSGSGVISVSNGTVGNSTVTINGAENSTTYLSGYGMIVETTTTLNTYTFHRLVPKATEVTTLASKATEMGLLGTAAAVEDMGILGTAAIVEDMSLLGTTACVADMALLGESAVIADMATIADTSGLISNIGTVAGAATNVNNVGGSIANVNTVAGNLSGVNDFGARYRAATNNAGEYSSDNDVGDLYFNTSINAIKVWNGSSWVAGVTDTGNYAVTTGNTFTGNNDHNDSVKVRFGSDDDLEIYHSGSDATIDNNTGDLTISTTGSGDDILITSADDITFTVAGSETAIQCIGDGAVELYHNNVKTFETESDGIAVIGPEGGNAFITFKADEGDDNADLFDVGVYDGGPFKIQNKKSGSWEDSLVITGDGDVELYYDGSKKLETTSSGVNITGGINVTDPIYDSSGGNFDIKSTGRVVVYVDDDEKAIYCNNNGAVELYYDAVKTFETTGGGAIIRGTEGGDANLFLYADEGDDNADQWRVQAHSDGSFKVLNVAGGAWETNIEAHGSGNVELFYDNSKKLETHSGGITVSGNIDCTGNIKVDDGDELRLGIGNDLKIYHDGTNSTIYNSTGILNLQNDGDDINLYAADDITLFVQGTEPAIKCIGNGDVELYYDGSKKLETASGGISVTGDVTATGVIIGTNLQPTGYLTLQDNQKIYIGTGNDLQIYHDELNSYVADTGTGSLILTANAFKIHNAANNQAMLYANEGGAVELYYDNSQKLATDATGIFVNGALRGDSVDLADSKKILLGSGDDLEIYHSGSHAFIKNSTGVLHIQGNNSNDLKVSPRDDEDSIVLKNNGAVELYYNNVKMLETTSGGAKVNGILEVTSHVKLGDGDTLVCGSGDDLQIYHSGTQSWINNTTGDLIIRNSASTGDVYIQVGGAELGIKAIKDGAVELFYDDSKKFETNASGIHVPGEINVKGNTYPDDDDSYDLGLSNRRWDNVYATSGTVNTSDKTEKNTIVESDLGLNFVNKLKPVSYKWNKNDGKTHYGLIAQDVEETLSTEGKTDKDFAALNIPTEGLMGLNYSEFISPLIKAIQELTTKIETLETEVAALKAK